MQHNSVNHVIVCTPPPPSSASHLPFYYWIIAAAASFVRAEGRSKRVLTFPHSSSSSSSLHRSFPLPLLHCYCLSLWSWKIKGKKKIQHIRGISVMFWPSSTAGLRLPDKEGRPLKEKVQPARLQCRSWVCLATGEKPDKRVLMIYFFFSSPLMAVLSSISACCLLPAASCLRFHPLMRCGSLWPGKLTSKSSLCHKKCMELICHLKKGALRGGSGLMLTLNYGSEVTAFTRY